MLTGELVWRQVTGHNVLVSWLEYAALASLLPVVLALASCGSNPESSRRHFVLVAAIPFLVVLAVTLFEVDPFAGRLFHVPVISVGHVILLYAVGAVLWVFLLIAGCRYGSRATTDLVIAAGAFAFAVVIVLFASPASETPATLLGGLPWGLFGTDDVLNILFLVILVVLVVDTETAPIESLAVTTLFAGLLLGLRGDEVAAASLPLLLAVALSDLTGICNARKRNALRSGFFSSLLFRLGALAVVALLLGGFVRLVEGWPHSWLAPASSGSRPEMPCRNY